MRFFLNSSTAAAPTRSEDVVHALPASQRSASSAAVDEEPQPIAAFLAFSLHVHSAPDMISIALVVFPHLLDDSRHVCSTLPLGDLLATGEETVLIEVRTQTSPPPRPANVTELCATEASEHVSVECA